MSTAEPLRIAVFASGGGTNFEALATSLAENQAASIVLCLSDREEAGVLERAARLGIATIVLSPKTFKSSSSYESQLIATLDNYDVNFIALAGYLKLIPEALVTTFRNRIVNIHPSLLPAFGGKGMYGGRVHEAVLASGTQWTGATVHLVDEEYDSGPIVLQEPVPVAHDDTPDTLAARVLKVEHRLYPKAISLFADKCIRVVGKRVVASDANLDTE